MTLDDLEKLLSTARNRIFKDDEHRGYFEDELIEAGLTEKFLKKARGRREITCVLKTKNSEPMRFYYLREGM